MFDQTNVVREIYSEFQLKGEFVSSVEINSGIINYTCCVESLFEGETKKFIFQKINHHVFAKPAALMQNIYAVTNHLKQRVEELHLDDLAVIDVIPTRAGELVHQTSNGDYWRCFSYIEDSVTYDICSSPELAYEAGLGFGQFLHLMEGFPVESLHDLLPDFHNTGKRYKDLQKAVLQDSYSRVSLVSAELDFLKQREDLFNKLVSALEKGEIPSRVTHNDLKISNVLFHQKTNKALSIIDLDTLMSGSALYDYGDLVRSSISTQLEDAAGTDINSLNLEVFETLTAGYLKGCPNLTKAERALMPLAGKIITLELAMRFLTDYLEGDKYFSVESNQPDQNLARCKNQINLVQQMESKEKEMEQILSTLI